MSVSSTPFEVAKQAALAGTTSTTFAAHVLQDNNDMKLNNNNSSFFSSVNPSEQVQDETFTLLRQNELRIEVPFLKKVLIKLLTGTAEIFGTEMALKKGYTLSGTKFAIFSWHGATVQITGEWEVAYISKDTPMIAYINTHMALEQMRQKSVSRNLAGPRVLVTGPSDVGKSTLAKILVNYAVRAGNKPLFVDLDPGQGYLTVPGLVGTVLVERPIDIEEGLISHIPLLFHFGHASPGENNGLYKALCTRLANSLSKRCEHDPKIRQSGFIINTCGWIEGAGFQHILHAISAFCIDVVITIDNERLFHDIQQTINRNRQSKSRVAVLSLPKSGGVVLRSSEYRRKSRMQRIHEYFYGRLNDFFPAPITIKLNDVILAKIGIPPVPVSCLPAGMEPPNNDLKVITVAASNDMLNSVLSVSAAEKLDDIQSFHDINIIGFLVVKSIDLVKREMVVLSPTQGKITRRVLLLSNVKYTE